MYENGAYLNLFRGARGMRRHALHLIWGQSGAGVHEKQGVNCLSIYTLLVQEESDAEWTQHLKWTLPYYTFRFCLYQDYLFFDFIFQSKPRVSSIQMGIVIHSGIH